jgi:O-antigen ligase
MAQTGSNLLSERATARIAAICLYTIATNAVLIQTIVNQESSLKTIIRVAVLGVAGAALLLGGAIVPRWVVITTLTSGILMLIGGNPDQLSYIFVLVLVALLAGIEPRRADRIFLLAAFVSLTLIFLLLYSGLTINEVRDFRNRTTYGVASIPFFMNVVYGAGALLILYCRKYRPHGGSWACAAYLVLATYFYSQTDSRGGYFALLAFVALLAIVPALSSSGLFRAGIALLPVVFVGFAFFIAGRAGDSELNQLLSNRPYNYRQFIDRLTLGDFFTSASVKQFDTQVTREGIFGTITEGTFVDNSYLHLLVGGGVVLTAVVLIAYAATVFELFRCRMYPEIALMTSSAFYFNTESILVRVENIFVIYIWYLIVRYGGLAWSTAPKSAIRHDARRSALPRLNSGSSAKATTRSDDAGA